ncbi:TBC1 domain family member 3B [Plecturocebus cupreus]
MGEQFNTHRDSNEHLGPGVVSPPEHSGNEGGKLQEIPAKPEQGSSAPRPMLASPGRKTLCKGDGQSPPSPAARFQRPIWSAPLPWAPCPFTPCPGGAVRENTYPGGTQGVPSPALAQGGPRHSWQFLEWNSMPRLLTDLDVGTLELLSASLLTVSWTAPGPWDRPSPGSPWGPRHQALPRPSRTKRKVGRYPHCNIGTCIWPLSRLEGARGAPHQLPTLTLTLILTPQPQIPWKIPFSGEACPIKAMREKDEHGIPPALVSQQHAPGPLSQPVGQCPPFRAQFPGQEGPGLDLSPGKKAALGKPGQSQSLAATATASPPRGAFQLPCRLSQYFHQRELLWRMLLVLSAHDTDSHQDTPFTARDEQQCTPTSGPWLCHLYWECSRFPPGF